jgi:hypothetical protein
VHPIERLRSVARAQGAGPTLLVREAAEALIDLDPGSLAPYAPGMPAGDPDPMALVTALRRLVDRHQTVGPMWWLAARLMASTEPGDEARRACEALEADPTPHLLATLLPDDATVVVVGWPEHGGDALRRRGDLEVLVGDSAGDGSGLARHLQSAGVAAELVPDCGLGSAVTEADLVLLEAASLGPDGVLAAAGSLGAAAVSRQAGIPVWVAAGVGRVLPARLWEALVTRLDLGPDEPWHCKDELVPLTLVDQAVRPEGLLAPEQAPGRGDCPAVPELLRPAG